MTTPVLAYIKTIREPLYAEQLLNADQLVERTKTDLKKWVKFAQLPELRKFQKHRKLEEVSDELSSTEKAIPRDNFKWKMHYILNDIQQAVEQKKKPPT